MRLPLPDHFPRRPLWLATGVVAVGYGVVPPLLTRAFADGGPAFLQDTIAANPHVNLDFVLGEWYGMVLLGVLACLTYALIAFVLRTPRYAERIVGRATPGTLGAIRALVCGILLTSVVWEHLPSTAALPREMIRPMGVLQALHLLPGFDAFLASPAALTAFEAFTAGALFVAMVGWRTRWTLPLAAVCYLVFGGLMRQYAWFYHTGLIPLYLLALLALLPAADGWSVDRLRRLWHGNDVPAADLATMRYGWARYALWVVLGLSYTVAGLSKFRNGGLFWWNAENFKYILFHSALRPMEFDFEVTFLLQEAPPIVFATLALSAILGEALYGTVLFSRTARRILPLVMAGMHVGIFLLQNILFFDLILLQVIFYDLRPLRHRLGRWWSRYSAPLTLHFDPDQPTHARIARLTAALDLLGRVRLSPLSGPLTLSDRNTNHREAALVRRAARVLPALWVFLPLLYVPGVAVWAYGRLTTTASGTSARPLFAGRLPAPRLALFLIALLLGTWVLRVEFYPLTSLQMFSKQHPRIITYELAWAHLASGAVVRAPIEQSIPAMSDSRYRRILERTFDPRHDALTEAFYRAVAREWNARAQPEQRIQRIEVQRWRWDFINDPLDRDHGEVVARKTYRFSTNAAVRPSAAHGVE